MQLINQIPGCPEFTTWCGGWPSFHDSEILTLELQRTGISQLVICVWGGAKPTFGPRANPNFACAPTDVIVTFLLEEVEDLELADFSSQNVIFDLRLEKESGVFRIHMDPCFGMAGFISAKKVTIKFAPVRLG